MLGAGNDQNLSASNNLNVDMQNRELEDYDEELASPFTECLISSKVDLNALFSDILGFFKDFSTVKVTESPDTYTLTCTMKDEETVSDIPEIIIDDISFKIKLLRMKEDFICLQFKSGRKGKFKTTSIYKLMLEELQINE